MRGVKLYLLCQILLKLLQDPNYSTDLKVLVLVFVFGSFARFCTINITQTPAYHNGCNKRRYIQKVKIVDSFHYIETFTVDMLPLRPNGFRPKISKVRNLAKNQGTL